MAEAVGPLATDPFVSPGGGAWRTAVIPVGFAASAGPQRSATIEVAASRTAGASRIDAGRVGTQNRVDEP
jgi:hypothetical protein